MPVYEYQCRACLHQFEEWQKIKDDPIKTCPSCSKDEVERLISQTAFQLKGGGWYKDLYSSSGKSSDKASNGKSEAKSESKGESKSGSTSDSKSESKSTPKNPTGSSGGGGTTSK